MFPDYPKRCSFTPQFFYFTPCGLSLRDPWLLVIRSTLPTVFVTGCLNVSAWAEYKLNRPPTSRTPGAIVGLSAW
jgi:hypothetical protein